MKKFIKNKNVYRYIVCVVLVLFIALLFARENTGILMSNQQKADRINKQISVMNYSRASELNEAYFKNSTDTQGKNYYKLFSNGIDVCKQTNTKSLHEGLNVAQKIINSKPVIVDKKYTDRTNGYANYEVTVENKGENTLRYVEINVIFYDKNGNIVNTKMLNTCDKIKPNSRKIVEGSIKIPSGAKTWNAEVVDYNN